MHVCINDETKKPTVMLRNYYYGKSIVSRVYKDVPNEVVKTLNLQTLFVAKVNQKTWKTYQKIWKSRERKCKLIYSCKYLFSLMFLVLSFTTSNSICSQRQFPDMTKAINKCMSKRNEIFPIFYYSSSSVYLCHKNWTSSVTTKKAWNMEYIYISIPA